MDNELLRVENLYAEVEEKEILKGINLKINKGEIHVIMGPNGSGKSTLANVLMANPVYKVSEGKIYFEGKDISELSTDKRARLGMFLSFQNPVEVSGITVENFIRQAEISREIEESVIKYKKKLKNKMDLLSMKEVYAERYLNEGFSGGEKKKTEILQMLMLNPKLAILDETDSGLDVDAVRTVSLGIKDYFTKENSIIIITHHKEILKEITPDYVHIIMDGKIVKESDASLIDEIEKRGYQWIKDEVNSKWAKERKLK